MVWIASMGSVQVMKSLSVYKAARCDEHQFRGKLKVSS